MIVLTYAPIETQELLDYVTTTHSGAVVLFLGTTRGVTGDRRTRALDYEAYESMARRQLERLQQQACERWPLQRTALVHRLGYLLPKEASVAVAVSAPHRGDAFDAARWLIDQLKEQVPIWKKEYWEDAPATWVMPGVPEPIATAGPNASGEERNDG